MDLSAISPAVLIASLMVASTPILLAALGELVTERAGVLNLGVEGMMIIGAIAGFGAGIATGSSLAGFAFAALAGAALSLIFALLVLVLLANQVASGLALTLFGLGLSALIGANFRELRGVRAEPLDIPLLKDIPFLGEAFFRHDFMVYLSILLVIATWYVLTRTRAGLILRAVGENHDAAHALGYNVRLIRLAAIAFGGAMAGLGGAYLTLVRIPQWTDGMTAGQGWIALAIVVFASWKPLRLLVGAYLFGGISVLQINLQSAGVKIPVEYLSMSPYVITILVLVVISVRRGKGCTDAPAALGQNFHAS